MADLGLDPGTPAYNYDRDTARRMQDRAAKTMAKDLKRSLGRGYKVSIADQGSELPTRGWNWSIHLTLNVAAPRNAWEEVVEVKMNIAEGETAGWIRVGSSGVLPVPRTSTPEAFWATAQSEAVSFLKGRQGNPVGAMNWGRSLA